MLKGYLQGVYGFWSLMYDSIIDKIFAFDRGSAVEALKLKKGENVLEIGVGTGLNLPFYPSKVKITGIDFSKAMLSKAAKKGKFELKAMDAEKMTFKVKSFDKVLTTYVLRLAPEE